ncbi:MAG: hypothetical protein IKP35_00855, partial [Alphaproteobacteria bacterium]|nr:hypothetical protein [Alphaproteobacteria bacterium]
MMVNGRISEKSVKRYKYMFSILRDMIGTVKLFAMASPVDAGYIKELGAPEELITVTGNTKFDQTYTDVTNEQREKILAGGWYMEAPSWAPGSRRLVYYETEKSFDGMDRTSHLRSVDITGQNLYDIELPDGVNGVEPSWSPKLQ